MTSQQPHTAWTVPNTANIGPAMVPGQWNVRETPRDVWGKNPDFPNLVLLPLPDGVAVRVANAVVWNGGEFIGLTLIRERGKPAQDAAMIMRSYLAGDDDRIQKLRNPSGLMPESIAIFFHLWDLPPIDWTFFDVPSPVLPHGE